MNDEVLRMYLEKLQETLNKMDRSHDIHAEILRDHADILKGLVLHLKSLEVKTDGVLEAVNESKDAALKMRDSATWLLITIIVFAIVEVFRIFGG